MKKIIVLSFLMLFSFSSCDTETPEVVAVKETKENGSNKRVTCPTINSKTKTFTWNMSTGTSAVVTMCYVNRNGASGSVVYWKFSNIIKPSNYDLILKRKELITTFGLTSCTNLTYNSNTTLSSTLSPNTWYEVVSNNNQTKYGLKALSFRLKLQSHFLIMENVSGAIRIKQSPTYTSPLYELF